MSGLVHPLASRLVPLALLALLAGCETLQSLAAGLDEPTARVTGVTFQELGLDGLTLAFDVEVGNPYDVELPLVGLDYALARPGGPPFLQGELAPEGAVAARGKRTLRIPARIAFAELLRVAEDVRPGAVVPWAATIGVAVDAPGLGRLRLPLERQGELPVPTLPDVKVSRLEWKELSFTGAKAVLELSVANGNRFPIDVEHLGLGLELGGRRVFESAIDESVQLAEGGARTLRIPLELSTAAVARAGLALLSGDSADYELAGDLKLGTRFGPLESSYRTGGRAPMVR